jgi:hypothetical protein
MGEYGKIFKTLTADGVGLKKTTFLTLQSKVLLVTLDMYQY